jgi:tRNA A58 N-methylase Trm61
MMNAEGASFVDPARIISQIDISLGATVADFGCGSGYFSFEFSKAVGPDGKVYALDILPQALEAVPSRKTAGAGANEKGGRRAKSD